VLGVTSQTLAAVAVEVAGTDDQQPEAVPRDLLLASPVVEPPLLAAANAADCLATIEEGHRLVVLALAVLDDEAALGVIGIDGQRPAAAVTASVADEPGKAVLAQSVLAEELVAEVDDVALVACAA
jgi:NaMN:DMB phosphoribosyltransferase